MTVRVANFRTKILDFRGFDSSRICISRGGIPRRIGDFPETLSHAILVRIIVVGRFGVLSWAAARRHSPDAPQGAFGATTDRIRKHLSYKDRFRTQPKGWNSRDIFRTKDRSRKHLIIQGQIQEAIQETYTGNKGAVPLYYLYYDYHYAYSIVCNIYIYIYVYA